MSQGRVVKIIAFRFASIGRPITNVRKFEEGIFSDLRNLKAGVDATLEPAKSEFLGFLFRNRTIRTQKKQKIFYWFSVPHDKLFMDALERDLRREFPLYPDLQGDFQAARMIEMAKDQCNGIAHIAKEFDNKPSHLQVGVDLNGNLAPPQPTPGGFVDQAIRAFESDNLAISPGGFFFNTNSSFDNLERPKAEPIADLIGNQSHTDSFPLMDWDAFSKTELSSSESFYEEDASQRTFSCPEPDCEASFKRKQHLIRHQQGHAGNRQFRCLIDGCNKSFTRQDNLSAHEKRCHASYIKKEEQSLPKAGYDGSFVDRKDPYFQAKDSYYMNYLDQSFNRIDQSFYSL